MNLAPQCNDRSQSPDALDVRAQANQAGDFDLGALIVQHLEVGPTTHMLEIGAGTGVHLAQWAHFIGKEGRCVALDVSAPSLDVLMRRAQASKVTVTPLCADMDALVDATFAPDLQRLDRVLSVYALYYSRNIEAIITAIAARLADDGMLLIVGPAPGNNREWYQLLSRAGITVPPFILDVSETFLPDRVLPAGVRRFQDVRVTLHTNSVPFHDAEALEAYWRSCIYHNPEHDSAVLDAIRRQFRDDGSFTVEKRMAFTTLRGPLR